ncbi:hypothetical protein PYCC9005_002558 [Savitreella phatthalungensis]
MLCCACRASRQSPVSGALTRRSRDTTTTTPASVTIRLKHAYADRGYGASRNSVHRLAPLRKPRLLVRSAQQRELEQEQPRRPFPRSQTRTPREQREVSPDQPLELFKEEDAYITLPFPKAAPVKAKGTTNGKRAKAQPTAWELRRQADNALFDLHTSADQLLAGTDNTNILRSVEDATTLPSALLQAKHDYEAMSEQVDDITERLRNPRRRTKDNFNHTVDQLSKAFSKPQLDRWLRWHTHLMGAVVARPPRNKDDAVYRLIQAAVPLEEDELRMMQSDSADSSSPNTRARKQSTTIDLTPAQQHLLHGADPQALQDLGTRYRCTVALGRADSPTLVIDGSWRGVQAARESIIQTISSIRSMTLSAPEFEHFDTASPTAKRLMELTKTHLGRGVAGDSLVVSWLGKGSRQGELPANGDENPLLGYQWNETKKFLAAWCHARAAAREQTLVCLTDPSTTTMEVPAPVDIIPWALSDLSWWRVQALPEFQATRLDTSAPPALTRPPTTAAGDSLRASGLPHAAKQKLRELLSPELPDGSRIGFGRVLQRRESSTDATTTAVFVPVFPRLRDVVARLTPTPDAPIAVTFRIILHRDPAPSSTTTATTSFSTASEALIINVPLTSGHRPTAAIHQRYPPHPKALVSLPYHAVDLALPGDGIGVVDIPLSREIVEFIDRADLVGDDGSVQGGRQIKVPGLLDVGDERWWFGRYEVVTEGRWEVVEGVKAVVVATKAGILSSSTTPAATTALALALEVDGQVTADNVVKAIDHVVRLAETDRAT